MRIDQLHVKNFRCFDDRTWSFAPGFNVLIGDNGAGKTALIDALKIATGSFFLGIDGISAPGILRNDMRYVFDIRDGVPNIKIFRPAVVAADGVIGGEKASWSRERRGVSNNTTYGGRLSSISMRVDYMTECEMVIEKRCSR